MERALNCRFSNRSLLQLAAASSVAVKVMSSCTLHGLHLYAYSITHVCALVHASPDCPHQFSSGLMSTRIDVSLLIHAGYRLRYLCTACRLGLGMRSP